MLKTYKFKLEPTYDQIEKIEQTLWLCRRLYNAMLEQRKKAYRSSTRTHLSYEDQANELPDLKKEFPEYKEVQSQVLQDVGKRLKKALDAFFRRLKNGETPGFPRFKGKNRYDSFTYPQSGFCLEGKFLKLSKIGNVRIKCHRQIKGKMKTCQIKCKAGKYYACLTCETKPQVGETTTKEVGIDLGVKHLAITSDGEFFNHPKYLRKSEKKIKYLQRMVSRRKKGSNRRRKAVRLLQQAWEQIANRRKDTAHKISYYLVHTYDLIVLDLKIRNMVKNHHLAKSIHDAGWGMLIEFTTYKAEYAGKAVEKVNPYHTSQACSECGQIVKKHLSIRIHECHCGYIADRDVNAARNILQKANGYIPEACGQ